MISDVPNLSISTSIGVQGSGGGSSSSVSGDYVNDGTGGGCGEKGHPRDVWKQVNQDGATAPLVGGGPKSPESPKTYAQSDYSDGYEDCSNEQMDSQNRIVNSTHKEKGKIPESVDLDALKG